MGNVNTFFGVMILCLIFGVAIGSKIGEQAIEKKAIEANVGYYDNKTKEFKFKDKD